MEDEGVITSFNEDYLEESEEDDYFDLEDDVDAQYGQPRQVHLVRHSQLGLGLSIKGGSEFCLPAVIVVAVKPGSPADRCRMIYVGDQIVSVNEVTLDETTCHQDALRLLAECGDKVCLGKCAHIFVVNISLNDFLRSMNTLCLLCTLLKGLCLMLPVDNYV